MLSECELEEHLGTPPFASFPVARLATQLFGGTAMVKTGELKVGSPGWEGCLPNADIDSLGCSCSFEVAML
jgi:hypothetical protein